MLPKSMTCRLLVFKRLISMMKSWTIICMYAVLKLLTVFILFIRNILNAFTFDHCCSLLLVADII